MSTYQNDPEQNKWELWFLISSLLFTATLFIGTLENSVKTFPNYPYYLTVIVINLLLCITIGIKRPKL
jgi:hypothetical protein